MEEQISREASSGQEKSQGFTSYFLEMLRFVLLAVIIVVPIRAYVAQPFVVSGASMDPTFHNGEYLIIDEISYRFKKPSRGDVVVFRYPVEPSKFFIKRIIGLPHETIQIQKGVVTIYNEQNKSKGGLVLDDSFVAHNSYEDINTTLGSDEYFVMGDNRLASSDSRYWGAVPRKNIIGKALIRLLPIDKIELHPGKTDQI